MKLQQGQIWKTEAQYFRITAVDRLSVKYKAMSDLESRKGKHLEASKKDFCRLIKKAALYTAAKDSESMGVEILASVEPVVILKPN